jgi:dihydrodipicolinate synthase/N-acetylneuraminate lyase
MEAAIATALQRGLVIPAMPLALNARRKLDERRQRALIRYNIAAGAGGLAVGVHTTQFAIRDVGLFRPVLELAAEEMGRARQDFVRVGGICGKTKQAVPEAETLREIGYHAGLLSLGALERASERELLDHARAVGEVLPLIGFYLQPAAGGRLLPYSFWRRFAELESLVAVKIAPFNRYQTLDVVRAVIESGRSDVALYTGNDDNIVMDLLTPFSFRGNGRRMQRRIVGGLLGHWAVWTRRAVELLEECHRIVQKDGAVPAEMLRKAVAVTDMNAAVFDAANGFAGCIAGVHEVLRRQGLLEGVWCLNPKERLSPGQAKELDRVTKAYPELTDDEFVAKGRDLWLNG